MPDLQQFRMTIDGRAAGSETFTVLDPATEQPWAEVPAATQSEVDAAFAAADAAFAGWAADDDARRAALRRAAEKVGVHLDELAGLLVREQGKPYADALGEAQGTVGWIQWFAEVEVPKSEVVTPGEVLQVRFPLGVVAGITPWNYPLIQSAWKFAPALRAGNTVVLKPSPYTPVATLRLGELLAEVLPPGVLNVVSGGDAVGVAMTTHPTTAMVSFTGSTAAGKSVAAAVAPDLKRVTLELGGNDPAILLDDVDVDAIAEPLFWGAFTNNGQVCGVAKRVYVPAALHDRVADALARVAESVAVGAGSEDGVRLGPINNRPQYERVNGLLEDAVAAGATVRSGGKQVGEAGYFLTPTILTDVAAGAAIVEEEQFGPVLPLVAYDDLDAVVAEVNASKFGLGGSVWSADANRALGVGRRLRVGTVYINGHAINHGPHVPFGGARWSGIGVENGLAGLEEYTQRQIIYGNGADL
ncbi:aldehyde dehydrogenase family protein [Nocardioides zeae]|uniref:Aldehyde dehydrogenase family protein n=1 Tax=Nocardioides imazamoxiresistens TaxID=3231893 RepID=A0ABU3PSE4_9ACTN|nr:aldehyde dehydrogenase family protein [Nocardioides zeae]MDT9592150.1 aldehyde dehydrogenase family protein [Nocardioides zeae]